MTGTPPNKTETDRAGRLTPGHWIAIAMIVAGVLGGVLSWSLSEHNARLATVDARLTTVDARMNNMAETLARIAEGQARAEGERKAITDRLDRIESNINTLVQLHLNTETR